MKTKKKNIIKISLDILMALLFAILMNKMLGGQTFHEIAGLSVGAFVIIHLLFNKEWLRGVTKKLFSKSLPERTRVEYIVNALLSTLYQNISIMAAFLVFTYYIDKLLRRKRKPKIAA